ncbi:MAG TPA: terminase family protein [Candidatus Dormibacteraeota bacterium]|nr:terminase family protein [Candidatus Dormibacteraeota bacterium]
MSAIARSSLATYFLPYQEAWILDQSQLRIIQKARQVGITYADAYDSVIKACSKDTRLDVWVSSRDLVQAKLYLEDCKYWAVFLHVYFEDLGVVILDEKTNSSAYVLQFANGRRIYCVSSNPNALAGKRGHVKLDEFALHEDQRLLYKVARPVTTWGGQLSIISTHRGVGTLFNEIITEIVHQDNPKKWSLHTVPVQKAVEQGLVERINKKTNKNETNEEYLARTRRECMDEDEWLQEYCCVPADESAAFITHEMISACEASQLRLSTFEELRESVIRNPQSAFFLGMDVARKDNLCVIDVGEKVGDVIWDRCRIELQNKTFSEIEFELFRLLGVPQVKRACIDATGMGMQLAERAQERFGWKVEPITFTGSVKEELAFGLRRAFEDRNLRIVHDDKLRSDLRALRKEITSSGNIRFAGESENSHCDRTWAKALRQHSARNVGGLVAIVG